MALDARAAAAKILGQVIDGKSMNQALPERLNDVVERDRGLVQQLCYGTTRQFPRLQALLDQLLDKPLRSKDHDVYALLMLGLYQLDDTRIPDHAAVAATVEATRALKKPWAKGLTNAVLRRYLRERTTLLEKLDAARTLAHPPWLHKKILEQWPSEAVEILKANNGQPPMSLRVNTRKMTPQQYLETLSAAGITAQASTICPQGIRLSQPQDVQALPGFAEGHVSVQDEAAQLAAIVVKAEPGERILDACSAPGGKCCHILELEPNLQELVAADVDDRRLEKVAENLHRLELSATLMQADGSKPGGLANSGKFDRILIDAPCSASGVIRRHPDVKLLRRPEDITQMAGQQLAIAGGLWPLLKVGGRLIYATCSIFDEENGGVVEAFLASHQDAELEVPDAGWGIATNFGRQLLPSADGADGLFYAVLHKTG